MQKSRNTLKTIKHALTIILLICVVLELCFYGSEEIAFGCLVELLGWLLISQTVLKEKYLTTHFISFIAIFFYGVSFFVLPIPATMLEGKPVTFRFSVPYLTFTNLMLNAITIVGAFHLCRKIYHEGWLSGLWKKIGFFSVPNSRQIWALAIFGFLALLWGVRQQGTENMEAENLGAFGQFLNVARQFAYVPVVFLFDKYWGSNKNYAGSRRIIIFYLVILALVAIASTRRTILVNLVFSALVLALFFAIYENKKLFSAKATLFLTIGLYLATGPLADLAMAMIINRASVYSSSSSSTFNNIMELYSDKERLHTLYQMGTYSNSDNGGDNNASWSEYYLDNIFLDRFCNLRTQDITLDYAQKLGYGSERMKAYAQNFIWFQVPTPILRAFGYKGNKFENNYTPGDLLSTDALGLSQQYIGFRVCGDSAAGLAWMGYWYYIFAFFIYTILFYFFASMTSYRRGLLVPIPVMVGMTAYATYFNNATGIFKTIALLLRTGWQNIIIYCLIMWIIKKVIK